MSPRRVHKSDTALPRTSHSVILSEARSAQPEDPCIPTATDARQPSPAAQHRTRLLRLAFLAGLLLLGFAAQSYAQGCTQCLDSTRATPPAVQAAYRHAILLLGGAGAAVFIAGVLFLRRNP